MLHPLKTIRAYRRLKRYRAVIFTLAKYGFNDIVDRIGPHLVPLRLIRRRRRIGTEVPTQARLRLALQDLGPTFVKFGQLLSTRPDILPAEYISELEKLQDEVPPFPLEDVLEIFRDELKTDPEALFASFESQPRASGSIAQVHRARLHSGEVVAVKIQRPRIRNLIETDLEILAEITRLVERHVPELRWFRPQDIVNQFATTIRRELDFVAEAQAAERFRVNFEDDPSYFVPRVFWAYSTERILTLDFVEGIKITDEEGLQAAGFDKGQIALNGAQAVLKEVFEHRFFHADPHPGNFFVLEGNVIAPFDFGIVGRLDEETADHLGHLVSSIVRRDADQMIRVLKSMKIVQEGADRPLLKFDIVELVDRYHGLPLAKLDAEHVIYDVLQILRRHRITLPVNLALIARMMAISAGVGRLLDPEFDLLVVAKPFVASFVERQLDPRSKLRKLTATMAGYQAILRDLPADLEEILAKIKKGAMSVALHHEGLDRFILEMDRSSNRLAFGLIVAALIIGSSLVMQLEGGPTVYGLPALGLIGYLIAGVLGLWLIIAILRSGRI
jgi:ubiquinone biosynthesis protein